MESGVAFFCLSCQRCLIRVTKEEADKKEVGNVAHTAPVAAGYFRNLLIPSLVPSGPQMFLATPRPTPRRLSADVLDRKIMWQRPTFSPHPRSSCSLRKRACLWLSRGRCFLYATEIRAPFQMANRNERLSGGYRCVRTSTKREKAAEPERTENTHAAECFKMSHSGTAGGVQWGLFSRLFAVIISWMCRMNMQWSQGGRFGLENES